jgi:hypothetical protein
LLIRLHRVLGTEYWFDILLFFSFLFFFLRHGEGIVNKSFIYIYIVESWGLYMFTRVVWWSVLPDSLSMGGTSGARTSSSS